MLTFILVTILILWTVFTFLLGSLLGIVFFMKVTGDDALFNAVMNNKREEDENSSNQ